MESGIRHYIELSKSSQKQIAKAFSCCDRMVVESLTYRKDTELARKIRYVALKEYGGKSMLYVPECETMFTTEVGGKEYMRQKFSNGAELLWQKGTPEVTVRFRGNEETFKCESLPRLAEIQQMAERM